MKRILLCFFAIFSISIAMAQQVSHTVQRGETLESIARKYSVTVEMIKQANPDATEIFFVGMKLTIPQIQEKPNNIPSYSNQTESIPVQDASDIVQREEQTFSQEMDNTTHEGVYLDTSYSAFELGVLTDKKLKFEGVILSMGWIINGFALRGMVNLKTPKTESVRNQTNYAIAAGYNARIRLADFVFVDLRPSVYYCHNSHEEVTGTELRETKNGSYYNVNVWSKKKSDSYGLLLEPRIGLQIKSFVLSIGYEWEFGKFKFKKENKSEGVYLGIEWSIN